MLLSQSRTPNFSSYVDLCITTVALPSSAGRSDKMVSFFSSLNAKPSSGVMLLRGCFALQRSPIAVYLMPIATSSLIVLRPSSTAARTLSIYGLPKIHKPGYAQLFHCIALLLITFRSIWFGYSLLSLLVHLRRYIIQKISLLLFNLCVWTAMK